MQNASIVDIIALVSSLAAVLGVVIQYQKTKNEGIGAIAEGYDKLTPHLNKRIDELTKELEADKKVQKELSANVRDLMERESVRSKGITAAVEYLKTSRSAIDNAIQTLETMK